MDSTHGATIPNPARPRVADRYEGQGQETAAPADQLAVCTEGVAEWTDGAVAPIKCYKSLMKEHQAIRGASKPLPLL